MAVETSVQGGNRAPQTDAQLVGERRRGTQSQRCVFHRIAAGIRRLFVSFGVCGLFRGLGVRLVGLTRHDHELLRVWLRQVRRGYLAVAAERQAFQAAIDDVAQPLTQRLRTAHGGRHVHHRVEAQARAYGRALHLASAHRRPGC